MQFYCGTDPRASFKTRGGIKLSIAVLTVLYVVASEFEVEEGKFSFHGETSIVRKHKMANYRNS